jgi:ribosomal protein S18 acetylase RimI-like enzyme
MKLVNGNPNHSTEQLADLIWTVDEHLMAFLFGSIENWRRLFASDWQSEESILSHSHAVVAIDDDKIMGVLIGYTAETIDRLFEVTLSRWLENIPQAEAEHLEAAFNCMGRLFPHPGEESFYVMDLAVSANNHKSGIGRKLMEWAESQAKELGLSALELDVDADSPAVGFYKKIGMHIEVETLVPEIAERHNVGRHYHMKMSLN